MYTLQLLIAVDKKLFNKFMQCSYNFIPHFSGDILLQNIEIVSKHVKLTA